MRILKETKEKNLINLKNSIDSGTIDTIIKPAEEWNDAYVIITSSKEKSVNIDSKEIYVITKHSTILSALFYFFKENILESDDYFLFGFMALLAIDYIRQNDESDDYVPFLSYIIDKIYSFFSYCDWNYNLKEIDRFDFFRYYLSSNISNNEISNFRIIINNLKRKELIHSVYEDTIKIQDQINNDEYKNFKKECKNLHDKYKLLDKEDKTLEFPDLSLPFFAYGIFKPNEIAYPRIQDFVEKSNKYTIDHGLYERDGIPFICRDDTAHETHGYLLYFKDDCSKDAYDIIRKTESKTFYSWGTVKIYEQDKANILFGRKPSRSNPKRIKGKYSGENDVFFRYAMRLVSTEMRNYKKSRDFVDFFKLQRNYMLLWAVIERYTSLKYGENSKSYNNKQLAGEKIFQDSLIYFVNEDEKREIFNSQTLNKEKLIPKESIKSINYYYTIRSNVVHRGKAVVPTDEKILRKSLVELLNIFQCVLKDTYKSLNYPKVDINIGEDDSKIKKNM